MLKTPCIEQRRGWLSGAGPLELNVDSGLTIDHLDNLIEIRDFFAISGVEPTNSVQRVIVDESLAARRSIQLFVVNDDELAVQ